MTLLKDIMTGMSRSLLSVWLCLLAARCTLCAEPSLRVEQTPEAVVIRGGEGAELLRYVIKKAADSNLASESVAYFHPLKTPAGTILTDVGPADHRHHRGVFLGWVEMHGGSVNADFWGWGEHAPTKGRRIVNREIMESVSGAGKAAFTARNEWLADDQPVLGEELRAEFQTRNDLHLLDLTFTLKPSAELTLSRWAFSGFCVRTRKDGVTAWDANGAVKLPPPQHTKPESDWPDRPWYACTLPGDNGNKAGVAVFGHPANPPTLWHNVTGIGMLNPCIVAPGAVKLPAGKPLTLRYRLVTFDGEVPTARLDELAREWAAR